MSPKIDDVRIFQEEIAEIIRRIVGEDVRVEWDVAKESEDAYSRKIYCPRLDIAVGPFNTKSETTDALRSEIFRKYKKQRQLISAIASRAPRSSVRIGSNRNPRCLMAIEVERTGTRKHRLGSIINSAALGKVGIVVGWDSKVTESLLKLQGYVDYLYWHGKLMERLPEALIINRSSFKEALMEW